MTPRQTELIASARTILESTDLPESTWAVGEFRDGRPCLVLEGDDWTAGYFERGHWDVEFTESDFGTALSRFAQWVGASQVATEAGLGGPPTGWLGGPEASIQVTLETPENETSVSLSGLTR